MRHQVEVQSSSQKKKKKNGKEKKEVKVQSDFLYLLITLLHKNYVIIYNISIELKFVINSQESYMTTNC